MHKTSLILCAVVLAVLNSGARFVTDEFGVWTAQPLLLPQPAQIAALPLISITVLLVLSRIPINALTGWGRHRFLGFSSSHRTTFSLLALVAISGSLGMA